MQAASEKMVNKQSSVEGICLSGTKRRDIMATEDLVDASSIGSNPANTACKKVYFRSKRFKTSQPIIDEVNVMDNNPAQLVNTCSLPKPQHCEEQTTKRRRYQRRNSATAAMLFSQMQQCSVPVQNQFDYMSPDNLAQFIASSVICPFEERDFKSKNDNSTAELTVAFDR